MTQPEIQCGLKIFFENSYDVNQITKALGVNPTHSANYLDSGYTRVTNEKLPGYWWYFIPNAKEYKSVWSLDEILTELFAPFSTQQIDWLKEVKETHNAEISININMFVNNDFPEMCFTGKNMHIIHELGADINLNLNRDTGNDE